MRVALWLKFRKITPLKENFWGVKVRWLTKAVEIFLGLKEEEYQSIQWLATTSREQKAYPKQKTYQIDVFFQFL